jgi:hypothetical protein
MNRNKIDRMFERKLASHEVAPSPMAWEKIQQKAQKKGTPWWVWGIAASVVVLATLAVFLKNQELEISHSEAPVVAENTPISEDTSASISLENTSKEELEKPAESAPNTPAPKVATPAPHKSSQPAGVTSQKDKPLIAEATEKNNASTLPEIQQAEADARTPATPAPGGRKTLIYTIAKLTTPESSPHEKAQGEEKEASEASEASEAIEATEATGMKRLMEIAKDVRNGEVGMADIREAKNELFAFNFKRKEKETQESK